MRKFLPLALLMFASPLAGQAQILPRVAVFGGYTFVRAQRNGGASFNLNGWDASLEGSMASWLGVVADVSQQYATSSGLQERQTSLLFGPQVSVPGIPRMIPFAHALVGVIHGTNGASSPVCLPGIPCFVTSTGNAFATAVGGGLDVKIAGPLWVRAIQADYLRAHLDPDHRTHARISAGIVLRFGR